MRPSLRRVLENTRNLANSTVNAYSIVLFTENRLVGLLLLLATFVEPFTGFSGLVGAIAAAFLSRLMGFDIWESRSGYFVFNSLLVSLGVGYYYPLAGFNTWKFLGLLVSTSWLTLLVFTVMNSLTLNLFKLPSLSFSFALCSILLCLFYFRLGNFALWDHGKPLVVSLDPALPPFVRLYFHSLGSIFFQPYFLSGAIVALMLLGLSRIGFALSVFGYGLAYAFLNYWNGPSVEGMVYPGFNLILIAMAIGGVFLLPSKTSYFMAMAAAFGGMVICLALQSVFRGLGVPPFTLPFNLVALTTLYALKLRTQNSRPYLVDFLPVSPEHSLEHYQSRIDRFLKAGVPQFFLPVIGEWWVTQGHHGEITHQRFWAYAWDFEILDNSGKKFYQNLDHLEDYYSFGKPVVASANGHVSRAVDGIYDNKLNQINPHDKWGNFVTLNHGSGFFTLYGHLKNGSVLVKPGEYVYKGQKIAQVGNSGRSAVPHLHFNVQLGPEPGAMSVFANIVNYRKRERVEEYRFHGFGVPQKGAFVSPQVPFLNLQEILHFLLFQEQRFRVTTPKGRFEESWKVSVDLYGTFYLSSDRGSVLEFSVFNGIFNVLSYRGSKDDALFALAISASRLPYTEGLNLQWTDVPPYSLVTSWPIKSGVLFLSALFNPLRVTTDAALKERNGRMVLTSDTDLKWFGKRIRRYQGSVALQKYSGFQEIRLTKNNKEFIVAERIKGENPS